MNIVQLAVPANADERSTLRVKASILFDGDELVVLIRDLSQGGAQLECDRPPPPQSLVTFKGNRGRTTARVAWRTGRRLGVQFLEPLSVEDVDAELGFGLRMFGQFASRSEAQDAS